MLQVYPSGRPLPDRVHLHRGRIKNRHTMERSIDIFERLQKEYVPMSHYILGYC